MEKTEEFSLNKIFKYTHFLEHPGAFDSCYLSIFAYKESELCIVVKMKQVCVLEL